MGDDPDLRRYPVVKVRVSRAMTDAEWAAAAAHLVALERRIDDAVEAARADAKARREAIRDLRGEAKEVRHALESRQRSDEVDAFEVPDFSTGEVELVRADGTGEVVARRAATKQAVLPWT